MGHEKIIYKCNGKKCTPCKKCGYTLDKKYRADKKTYGIFHEIRKGENSNGA